MTLPPDTYVFISYDDKAEADRICAYLQTFRLATDSKLHVLDLGELRVERPQTYNGRYGLVMRESAQQYSATTDKMYTCISDFTAGWNVAMKQVESERRAAEEKVEQEKLVVLYKRAKRNIKQVDRMAYALVHYGEANYTTTIYTSDLSWASRNGDVTVLGAGKDREELETLRDLAMAEMKAKTK
jgi:hypothetical protein